MAADPVGHYDQRNALIVTLKQEGKRIREIAAVVSLSSSRVGQILQLAGAATDRWVCPMCGGIVGRLGSEGWCDPCESAEEKLRDNRPV